MRTVRRALITAVATATVTAGLLVLSALPALAGTLMHFHG